MGVVFKMYSNESRGGKFTPARAVSGWSPHRFSPFAIYPEHLTDMKVLVCPSDPAAAAGVGENILNNYNAVVRY